MRRDFKIRSYKECFVLYTIHYIFLFYSRDDLLDPFIDYRISEGFLLFGGRGVDISYLL